MSVFCPSPETFTVEEVPAYLPQGQGEHTFVWIEKVGLTTNEAVKRLAQALDISARDIGFAGQKDRHATTRQWLSLPRIEPARALAVQIPDLTVHTATPHGNKLRLGHLKGNRFKVVLQDMDASETEALQQRFSELARDGLPNRFGAQRFGARGDNVATAIAVLRRQRREKDGRHRRFLYSALQSEVFNRVLERRVSEGLMMHVLAGDVLQKIATGGLFVSTDTDTDQGRVAAGELVITGPLPGTRTMAPPPDSPAAALEAAALDSLGVTTDDIAAGGRDMPGTRRPLLVPVVDAQAQAESGGRMILQFTLPSGTYATVLVQALGARLASTLQRSNSPAPPEAPW